MIYNSENLIVYNYKLSGYTLDSIIRPYNYYDNYYAENIKYEVSVPYNLYCKFNIDKVEINIKKTFDHLYYINNLDCDENIINYKSCMVWYINQKYAICSNYEYLGKRFHDIHDNKILSMKEYLIKSLLE